MRSLRIIVVLIALFTTAMATAEAAPITWTYTGNVVTAPLHPELASIVPVGTFFSLTYTFDSNTPNSCPFCSGAQYDAVISETLSLGPAINNQTLNVKPGLLLVMPTVYSSIFISDPVLPVRDTGWRLVDVDFVLDFRPNPVFPSLALPLVQPNPANTDPGASTANVFFNRGACPLLPCDFDQAHVVLFPVQTVPEPSTWLLFGSGLVGIAFFRKKHLRKV
jgi:hypothetical protein